MVSDRPAKPRRRPVARSSALAPPSAAKRCPYCLGEHERPRAVYCCPEHAQRAANERRRAAGWRQRNRARTMTKIRERAERKAAWRNALRIPGVEGVATAIFGTAPAATVRHGDTLDG